MQEAYLYHATSKSRAKQILAEGRFAPINQFYGLSQKEFNYFYASYRFDGGVHYQSLMTAMASDAADICVIQIPMEEVMKEKPYMHETFLVGGKIVGVLSDDVEWEDLLREEDIAEVLLKPFSFDVRKATLWTLDWMTRSTQKQFLEVLLNKTYADGIGYLPYAFGEATKGMGNKEEREVCYVDVCFDRIIRVERLFEDVRGILGEEKWKKYKDEIRTTLLRKVIDEEDCRWSLLFEEYESAYTKEDWGGSAMTEVFPK